MEKERGGRALKLIEIIFTLNCQLGSLSHSAFFEVPHHLFHGRSFRSLLFQHSSNSTKGNSVTNTNTEIVLVIDQKEKTAITSSRCC